MVGALVAGACVVGAGVAGACVEGAGVVGALVDGDDVDVDDPYDFPVAMEAPVNEVITPGSSTEPADEVTRSEIGRVSAPFGWRMK